MYANNNFEQTTDEQVDAMMISRANRIQYPARGLHTILDAVYMAYELEIFSLMQYTLYYSETRPIIHMDGVPFAVVECEHCGTEYSEPRHSVGEPCPWCMRTLGVQLGVIPDDIYMITDIA